MITSNDVERASEEWGANCGPCALAVICGLTLDQVRTILGPSWPGYTNPTAMRRALSASGVHVRELCPQPYAGSALRPWPRWGLCRIQWEGPWTQPGVPMRARYRNTHWVGAATRQDHAVGVWDVNALSIADGHDGWVRLKDWTAVIVPWILEDYKRASGGWHITHSIEVDRPNLAADVISALAIKL